MPGSASAAEGYRGRTVAITGASGFIGTALRRRLAAVGAVVHAVSRAELATPGALDELLHAARPEVLFHLAGVTSAGRELDLVQPTFTANAVSTVNVLTSLAAHSPESRAVLAGSLEEPRAGEAATSPYALSKATAAAYGRLLHELHGTSVVHLRVFMVYGPGQAAVTKLVPSVALALLRGEPAQLASGARRVDWVYVEDVADAFLAAGLAGDEADGKSIDVGSGSLVSVREVAEEIARIVGGGDLRFGDRPDRPGEVERVADPEPAAELLGWRATTPLQDGLRKTVDYYSRSSTAFRA
jgi:nucleoside-diphosphate-sugar epimerase